MFAPNACFQFPIRCSVSIPECIKCHLGRKSRRHFALLDPCKITRSVGEMPELILRVYPYPRTKPMIPFGGMRLVRLGDSCLRVNIKAQHSNWRPSIYVGGLFTLWSWSMLCSVQLQITFFVTLRCWSRHIKSVHTRTNTEHIDQHWLTTAVDKLTTKSQWTDVQHQNKQPIRGGPSTLVCRQLSSVWT